MYWSPMSMHVRTDVNELFSRFIVGRCAITNYYAVSNYCVAVDCPIDKKRYRTSVGGSSLLDCWLCRSSFERYAGQMQPATGPLSWYSTSIIVRVFRYPMYFPHLFRALERPHALSHKPWAQLVVRPLSDKRLEFYHALGSALPSLGVFHRRVVPPRKRLYFPCWRLEGKPRMEEFEPVYYVWYKLTYHSGIHTCFEIHE